VQRVYLYVLLIVTVVLTVRHLRSDRASSRSKRLAGGLTTFAILAPFLWPAFLPLRGFVPWGALVLQFAISGYIAFHQAIWPPTHRTTSTPSSERSQ